MEGVSMMYAKFFPSDWRTGCLTLTLEEEGLYIRVCAYMYDTGKPLPDKDKEASQLLRVQVQKYEKVMRSLIAKGKMIRAQGFIINERVQEEWHRYMMMMANRAEAAKKREATRKRLAEEVEKAILEQRAAGGPPLGTPQATPPPTPLGTPPTSVEGTPPGQGKLANKINERRAQTEHDSAHNLESRIQKLESKEEEDGLANANPVISDKPEMTAEEAKKAAAKKAKEEAEAKLDMSALEAFHAYNEVAQRTGLPQARTLTPSRRAAIKARLRDHGPESWAIALANLEKSAHCRGRNDRNWTADLDFVAQAKSYTRLVETGYKFGGTINGHDAEHPEETPQQRNRRLMEEAVASEKTHGH